jgi:hypothetical protein
MYKLSKSPRHEKKYRVTLPNGRKVNFGAVGYSDYTKHKNSSRMQKYITRHRKAEDWTRSGVGKAGFWARWILWSEPNLNSAIRRTEKILGTKIVLM